MARYSGLPAATASGTSSASPSITVSAVDKAAAAGQPAELTFAFDKTTGQNGDTLHLTITAVKANAQKMSAFGLFAAVGDQKHFWVGAVGN